MRGAHRLKARASTDLVELCWVNWTRRRSFVNVASALLLSIYFKCSPICAAPPPRLYLHYAIIWTKWENLFTLSNVKLTFNIWHNSCGQFCRDFRGATGVTDLVHGNLGWVMPTAWQPYKNNVILNYATCSSEDCLEGILAVVGSNLQTFSIIITGGRRATWSPTNIVVCSMRI